jgi:hypothetical protein
MVEDRDSSDRLEACADSVPEKSRELAVCRDVLVQGLGRAHLTPEAVDEALQWPAGQTAEMLADPRNVTFVQIFSILDLLAVKYSLFWSTVSSIRDFYAGIDARESTALAEGPRE